MTEQNTILLRGASLLGEQGADVLVVDGVIAEVGSPSAEEIGRAHV